MSLWSFLKEQAAVGGRYVASSAQWFWNSTPLVDVNNTLTTFASKTMVHVLEEGVALYNALHTLSADDPEQTNAAARKVLTSMAYVVFVDALPMVALNGLNNKMQQYFLDGYEEQQSSSGYLAFVSVLSFGNYFFAAYVFQRSLEASLQMTVLNSFAPSAFNANKVPPPASLCTTELNCTTKHKVTGMTREFMIMSSNEILIAGISHIPHVGNALAKMLTIINVGRYITRVVTPERCEDHKFMEQEFVFALGLTFTVAKWLMERDLNAANAGPIPFLYLRVFNHFLLALHVDIAAHMVVPSADSSKATLPFDLFNHYEAGSRYLIGALWGSLPSQPPKWFKTAFPLSSVLKFGTRALNRDQEREPAHALNLNVIPPLSATEKLKMGLLRPMFHSTYNFTRDRRIAPYWSQIRSGALDIFMTVENIGKSRGIVLLAWGPGTAARILDYRFGVPRNLTKTILKLSREEDFWEFTGALIEWFKRHDLERTVHTTAADNSFDDNGLIELPKTYESVEPATQLRTERGRGKTNDLTASPELVPAVQELVVPSEQLKSERKRGSGTVVMFQSLALSTPIPVDTPRKQESGELDKNNEERVDPAYSLFTTRRRRKPGNQNNDIGHNPPYILSNA